MIKQPAYNQCRVPVPTPKEAAALTAMCIHGSKSTHEMVIANKNEFRDSDFCTALRKIVRVGWVTRKRFYVDPKDLRHWYYLYDITPLGTRVVDHLTSEHFSAQVFCGNCAAIVGETDRCCPNCHVGLLATHIRSDYAYDDRTKKRRRRKNSKRRNKQAAAPAPQSRVYQEAVKAAEEITQTQPSGSSKYVGNKACQIKPVPIAVEEIPKFARKVDQIGFRVLERLVNAGRKGRTLKQLVKGPDFPWSEFAARDRLTPFLENGIVSVRAIQPRKGSNCRKETNFFYADTPLAPELYEEVQNLNLKGKVKQCRILKKNRKEQQAQLPLVMDHAAPEAPKAEAPTNGKSKVSGLTVIYPDGTKTDYPEAVVTRRTQNRTFFTQADGTTTEIPNVSYRQLVVW